MPIYNYNCHKCQNDFGRMLPANKRNNPVNCPMCGELATRLITAPAAHVEGGDLHASFEYRASRALEGAKEERRSHEDKFGQYKEYMQDPDKPMAERSHVDREDIDYIGDVQGLDADDSFD